MARKQFDNDSSVQALEGAVQANTVPTITMLNNDVVITDYLTADIPNAIVTVCNVSLGAIGRFVIENGFIQTSAIYTNNGITGTKDTATKLNVYIEGGAIRIQNITNGTIDVTLSLEAFGVDFK